MKKYLILIFYSLSIHAAADTSTTAEDATTQIDNTHKEEKRSDIQDLKGKDFLQLRAAFFFFTEKYAGAIYPPGSISLEIENNYLFYSHISTWANFNFTWTSGSPPQSNIATHMNITCLSAGLKSFIPIQKDNTIQLYLGCGLSAALILTKDETIYLPKNLARFSPGIVAKSGVLFLPYKKLMIDVFFDYYFQPTSRRIDLPFYQTLADVGGFRTGLGLGYLF